MENTILEKVMLKLKDMFEKNHILFVGSIEDDDRILCYEYNDYLHIAKISYYMWEEEFADDLIEMDPTMEIANNVEEAWNFIKTDLGYEMDDFIEQYFNIEEEKNTEEVANDIIERHNIRIKN